MVISNKDQKEYWITNKTIEELHCELISKIREDQLRKYEEKSQILEDVLNKKQQRNHYNNYNPSSGIFLPYLTEEIQNMIKTLKIDSISYKISNEDRNEILTAVVHCLLYHHYNSKDFELLHNLFLDFNQKLCEKSLSTEEMEDLWIQETAFIEVRYNEDQTCSFIKYQAITKEGKVNDYQ